jgi:hypothetical protein
LIATKMSAACIVGASISSMFQPLPSQPAGVVLALI